jgi:hypothetical protein
MTPAHLENCKMKGRYVERLSRKAGDFPTKKALGLLCFTETMQVTLLTY